MSQNGKMLSARELYQKDRTLFVTPKVVADKENMTESRIRQLLKAEKLFGVKWFGRWYVIESYHDERRIEELRKTEA